MQQALSVGEHFVTNKSPLPENKPKLEGQIKPTGSSWVKKDNKTYAVLMIFPVPDGSSGPNLVFS